VSTRKPERPGLPSSREQILVPGLPAPEVASPPATRPAVAPPAPYPGVQGYGRQPAAGGRPAPKRADPVGMKRESYYVTQQAADAIEQAVEQIRAALGGEIPKQVVLSALLMAGAERAGEVAARIAADQTRELASRLDALRQIGQ